VGSGAVREITGFHTVRAGEMLQHAHQVAQRLRFVKTGLVLVRHTGLDGVARPVAIVGSGHLLGQSGLVGRRTLHACQALTDVAVCDTPCDGLKQAGLLTAGFVQGLAQFNRRAFTALADWSHLARVPDLVVRSALALLLLSRAQSGGSRMAVPAQAVLAELLCVTRESVSRSLRALETAGALVRLGRSQMDLDLEVLRAIAGAVAPSSEAGPEAM
jgi:CRP-like cAMP-binding protein